MFAARLAYLDLAGHRIRVHDQRNAKTATLTLPTMGKRRTSVWVPGASITGYDLDAALSARVAEITDEQEHGINPLGLLFPNSNGGMINASNFDSRIWKPAMAAAGVSYVEHEQQPGKARTSRQVIRLYRFTTHSLRDRSAISAINEWGYHPDELVVVGGWKDATTIYRRCSGSASRVLDALQDRTAQRLAPEQVGPWGADA